MATTYRVLLAAVCLVALAAPGRALTAAEKCQAAKTKAAGQKSYCLAKRAAKQIKGGTADFAKCSATFSDKFAKAEATAGAGVCPTEGDTAAIEGQIDADAAAIEAALGGGGMRFIDNGDGTVTDTQTGLMWEKKTDDSSIHDKDNTYVWSTSGTDPDGTAFTTFLGGLNNCTSTDGTAITGGFAGHCDWRLPTSAELQTILLEPFPCGTDPCIDPAFGPTADGNYWSSTTDAGEPSSVWIVDFGAGFVGMNEKALSNYIVRAVRAGS